MGVANSLARQGVMIGFSAFWNVVSIWCLCDKHAWRRADIAVTCQWAPDGQHLLTSTIAPRVRVDNAFQIYK